MSSRTLPYATLRQYGAKPTHHSALAGWSWLALILEAAYRGSVVAYAYHKSPQYSPLDWEHFARNLLNRGTFVAIDASFLVIGICLGVVGLLPRNRKRWAALVAIAANLIALCVALDIPLRNFAGV